MKRRSAAMLAAAAVLACAFFPVQAGEGRQAMRASGSFDVEIQPQAADSDEARASGHSRMSIGKRYHGPLDASAHGEMLAAGDGSTSGAYVAVEKVEGTLDGRAGSFMLVHRSLMRDGTPQGWTVDVVPGTGTGELDGIDGSLRIILRDGGHFYEFDYSLPGS